MKLMWAYRGGINMGRNDIRLDQINARLGDMNKRPPQDAYDEDGNVQEHDDGDDEGGSSLNAAFVATLVGLFLAVSGGTYMYSSGINPLKGANLSWNWQGSEPVVLGASSADGECIKDWMTGYMNINQMHCYMKTRIARLCNTKERDTFVARILIFQDDYDTFQNKLLMATAKMSLGTPMSDRMQLGIEAAKMDNAKTSEEAANHEQNAMDIAAGMLAGTNAVLKGQKYQDYGYGILESDLRSLGEKGYVALSDFPSYPARWVTDALGNIKISKNACKG